MATTYRLDELPRWAGELLERERVARLGLLDDDDRPRVLPITFARAGETLWSAIDDKPKRGEPARLRFLRRRPAASLTVDYYDDDWSRLAWVQVLGEVEIAEAAEREDALAALAAKYEQYRDDPPPGPLLGLHPRRIVCWRAADAKLGSNPKSEGGVPSEQ